MEFLISYLQLFACKVYFIAIANVIELFKISELNVSTLETFCVKSNLKMTETMYTVFVRLTERWKGASFPSC